MLLKENDMNTKATSNGPVKTTYTTCGGCEKLSLELAKLRKALVVADKALGAAVSAINGLADQQAMSDDFYLADLAEIEQARTEIADILEGKE
jgi:hypothetical protein